MSDFQDLGNNELPDEIFVKHWNVRDGSGVGGVWYSGYTGGEAYVKKAEIERLEAENQQLRAEMLRSAAELVEWKRDYLAAWEKEGS
jgi:hypothetical protein